MGELAREVQLKDSAGVAACQSAELIVSDPAACKSGMRWLLSTCVRLLWK